MKKEIKKPLVGFPYPTACGYRCYDGNEWRDCDKNGKPHLGRARK